MKKIFLAVFILIALSGCKGKETPKPAVVVPPHQEVKTMAPEPEKKAIPPADATPNQPPRVTSVDVVPLYPKVGDTLKITASATDPDSDEITLIYKWFKNDELLSENSDALHLTKDFKRGDRITLNVIPDDGKTRGSQGLMKVTIGNSPPEITSSASESRFGNQQFIYHLKAVDPENDPLTFSLKTAPQGMEIDPSTGMIQWRAPSGYKGKVQVTAHVSDGNGGEALQSFVFEIGD